jgi:hypothetical protein
MPTPPAPPPVLFVTEDGLVTFLFSLGVDPSSPTREPLVTADVELFWEGSSPPEPITAEIRPGKPGVLAHISDNGETLDGTLRMQPMPGGQLAIFGDVFYGDRDDHHIVGVMAIFSPDSSSGSWSSSSSGNSPGHG